jgi:hypothetical protein
VAIALPVQFLAGDKGCCMLAVITPQRERFAPSGRDAFPPLHLLGEGLQLGPRLRQPRVRIPPAGRAERLARADPREPLLQALGRV